ncbi:MAG: flagellar basal-body rod protein FlgF [Acidobacteria bacterium]|nr:flagellar basal-body rod protein FlgF [Acidobacteriota bacterium]MCB9397408.1 flagellar basal-body rod protein FlgF [Acidobacteriota bacterium]
MNSEIYTAAQGMVARQIQMDLISHNMANANTTGFRSVDSFFQVYNRSLEQGPSNPLNNAANNQPVLAGSFTIQKEGQLKMTGNPADLAIKGKGYFKVQTPFGNRYTRNGHFGVNGNGNLVTDNGYLVLGTGDQPISVSGDWKVGRAGQIVVDNQTVGQLALVDVTDPAGLVPEEDTLLASLSAQNQEQPAQAEVLQGYLETSNVDIAQQMVSLIEAHRSYEMNTRLIRSIDREMNQAVIQALGRR